MTTVAIVGALTLDHLVRVDVGARFDMLGGPGLYGALGARLVAGTSAAIVAGLPADEPRFARVLDGSGIDTANCVEIAAAPKLWILDSRQGRRIVPTAPSGQIELAGSEDSPLGGGEAEWPSVDTDGVLFCAPGGIPESVASTTLVGVDPEQREVARHGWDYWRSVARPGGVLLPSRIQLAGWPAGPRAAARELASTLRTAVVVRLDIEGAFAVDATGRSWSVTDADAKVVDTTGAGDAMAGATVAALTAGAPLEVATAFGVSAARLALSTWGADGLLGQAPLRTPLPAISITEE
jgi:sugar/nucleoside kinase (ribokinase family)